MPILSRVNSIEVEKSIIYHNELKVDVVFSWSQPHVAKNMKNLCILFFFPPHLFSHLVIQKNLLNSLCFGDFPSNCVYKNVEFIHTR